MLTNWFYKKLFQSAVWVNLLILAGLLFLFANIEIKDSDLWFHFASGRFILDHFAVPSVDVFSFSVAGQPWNNHEWLFQVIIAEAYRFFGVEGWIALRLVLVVLICFHLFIIGYSHEKPFWPILCLILTVLCFSSRLLLRPELFSLLFFVMFIHILSRGLHQKKTILSLFLLQILWVNIHGFFIFGIILVGISILSEFLKMKAPLPSDWKKVGRFSVSEFKHLQWIFLSLCVACFLNPNVIEGAIYPLKILFSMGDTTSIFFDYIQELQKPISLSTLFSWQPYPFYRMLILLPLAGFILNRHKLDIGIFLLWIIFLLFSLNASRNVGFYAIVAYFVTLINMMQVDWQKALPGVRSINSFEARRLFSVAAFFILCGTAVYLFRVGDGLMVRGYYDFDTMTRKSERGGVSQRNFPHKAADFLQQNHLQGNILNDFNSGAYLLGRLHPQNHVFIDGRTELYGSDFFKMSRKIWNGDHELLDNVIHQYNIEIAFLNAISGAPPEPLIQYFHQHSDWQLVYFDYDAMIYLKNRSTFQSAIHQFGINIENWRPPLLNVPALGSTRMDPYRQLMRAEMLMHLGEYALAKAELKQGQIISPNHSKIYQLLGEISLQEKNYPQALVEFRQALTIDARNDQARFYFGKTLYFLHQFEESQKQLARVNAHHPDSPRVLFYLGLIEAEQRNFEGSWPILERAVKLMADQFSDFLERQPLTQARKVLIQERFHERTHP